MVVLFGAAYNQLVNSDVEMKKELAAQTVNYQILSEHVAAMTANQAMVMQLLRDNSSDLKTLVQRVYLK